MKNHSTLTPLLIKQAGRAYDDFLEYLNDSLPEDIGPDFYNKIYTDFADLPMELQFGYYVSYLNQYKLADNLRIDDINTILSAFKQVD